VNLEEAQQFWDTVAEPLRITDLNVGDTALLEDCRTGAHRFIIIVSKEPQDDGSVRVTIRNAEADEVDDDARSRVIVAG
jgi:RPA family protein